ncbi:hypothetical protein IWX47DRAFT_356290 [Phyllosticta citricarpa]
MFPRNPKQERWRRGWRWRWRWIWADWALCYDVHVCIAGGWMDGRRIEVGQRDRRRGKVMERESICLFFCPPVHPFRQFTCLST